MAARPGSAPGARKSPRTYQIAIEVQPDPDGDNNEDTSVSESYSEDYGESSITVSRRSTRGDRSRRSRSPSRFPRKSRAASEREVVITVSDESGMADDGRRGRSPCRVHPGYSTGPAGLPAPRIPRSGHRRVTHCSLMPPQQIAMTAPTQSTQPEYKGTRMVWKLSPDGTLNVTMGPPPIEGDDEKAKQAKEDEAAMEGKAPEKESSEKDKESSAMVKRVRSSISIQKLRTAGFVAKPRAPVVFETVIGPRPGLTPAVIKPPDEQNTGSDSHISIVSRVDHCTCPPPMAGASKNEHAHCQELLLELLERQEQAAQQVPQINLITPPPRRDLRRGREVAMCGSPRRPAQSPRHIMEIAAAVDSAVLGEEYCRPAPLLHIMEPETYDDYP